MVTRFAGAVDLLSWPGGALSLLGPDRVLLWRPSTRPESSGHRPPHFARRTPGAETMHALLDDFFERSLLLADLRHCGRGGWFSS
jgi:hypothetical protein